MMLNFDFEKKIDRDIVLYARWTPKEYCITYNLDGGINSVDNPTSYNIESEIIELLPAKQTGFVFEGWFIDEGLTNGISVIQTGSAGDIQLYAGWSPRKNRINYNLSGGVNNSKNPSYFILDQADIVLFEPTKLGYSFNGWFINNTKVEILKTDIAQDVTLYAEWTPITYQYVYNYNYGENPKREIKTYTINQNINLSNIYRENYEFEGWFWDKNCNNPVISFPSGTTGDKEFFAKWTPVKYRIEYNLNG